MNEFYRFVVVSLSGVGENGSHPTRRGALDTIGRMATHESDIVVLTQTTRESVERRPNRTREVMTAAAAALELQSLLSPLDPPGSLDA